MEVFDNASKFLTNPKIVKISAIIGVCAISIALLIGVIIAQFDPEGYNVIFNYISDMGSLRHTPFPYLWDFGQMICACSMIPAAFYLKKVFTISSEKEGETKESTKIRRFLNNLTFLSILTTLLGMFMVGLFSEDRTTEFHLHSWFSYVVWSAFAATSFFLGLLISFYPSPVPRALGPYMIILPPIACSVFLTTFNMFSEWILMFSLMGWIIPVAIIMLKHINKEIAGEK